MLKLVQISKKNWNLMSDNKLIKKINLVTSSLSGKFEIIQKFLDDIYGLTISVENRKPLNNVIANKTEDLLKIAHEMMVEEEEELVETVQLEFHDWLEKFLIRYIESNMDANLILEECDLIRKFSAEYILSLGINFSNFINKKKTTKTSIIFEEKNLEAIAVSSTALKIYSIFSSDTDFKVPKNLDKLIFEKLTEICYTTETIDKIFHLMKARTYNLYPRDKFLWDICKMKNTISPDNHIITIFNHVMSQLFIILDPRCNPIPFFNSVVDKSINWIMMTAHNSSIIYKDYSGNTDDIFGSPYTQESLHVYACNDVIIRAAEIGMKILREEYKLTDFEIDIILERVEKVDDMYPYMKLIHLPIISGVLEIPYKYLLTTSPRHIILMGLFMYHLSKGILDSNLPYLMNFLISIPSARLHDLLKSSKLELNKTEQIKTKKGSYRKDQFVLTTTRSSYSIKNVTLVINNNDPFFGFGCPMLKYNVNSSFCGILSASKKSLINIFNGKFIPKITSSELEKETTYFCNNFYSKKFDKIFLDMRNIADEKYF